MLVSCREVLLFWQLLHVLFLILSLTGSVGFIFLQRAVVTGGIYMYLAHFHSSRPRYLYMSMLGLVPIVDF